MKHAAGAYARVLATPRGRYALYFDGDGPSTIVLDLPVADYEGAWIDIETGKATPLVRFHHSGGERVVTTPNFRNGIALQLDRI